MDSNNNNLNKLNNTIEKISFSVDRFEDNFAVCENLKTGEFINISILELPENIKEGSIIILENGKFILDIESTKNVQKEIKNLVDNLFKRKK